MDAFLRHYGVLGMKWGKRKGTSIMGAKVKSTPSEDAALAKTALTKAKTKGLDSLTNKELQSAITRQNLEQQYSKLNPTTVARGRQKTGKILENVGTQLASEALKAGVKTGVEYGIKAVLKK